MTSRYEVNIGGVKLSSLDKNILILNIGYSDMEMDDKPYETANLYGYDLTQKKAVRQKVIVTFEIHIYDIAKRNEVCQKINVWADSSNTFATSDRKGQYLRARCEQHASIDSARDWTAPITMTFVSYWTPYWLSNSQKTLTLIGKSAKGTLKLDGNTDSALVDVEVTANATITAFSITVGSTKIELSGISVQSGQKMTIAYTRSRYLAVRANGSSVISKVKPTSSDVLLAKCGADNAVSISANGKVTAVIKARGMWI